VKTIFFIAFFHGRGAIRHVIFNCVTTIYQFGPQTNAYSNQQWVQQCADETETKMWYTVNREMFATLKDYEFAFFQLVVDKISRLLHKFNG
jgi:hypothetical protein